jgi:hypothetical protein
LIEGIKMAKGIFALEDNMELVAEVPEVVEAAPVDAFVEAPEAAVIELNDAVAQIESVVDAIEEASDTAETLEVMNERIEESVEEGGMSEPEAEAIAVAVEHMCARLSISRSKKVFPAMEGFKDKATRVQSTKVAMEGIAETIKKIWEGIVNAFKSAVAWVQKHIAALLDVTKKYEGRAKEIAAKAKAAEGKAAPADAKVKTSAFGKALSVNGKVLEGAAFASAYDAYLAVAQPLAKGSVDVAKEAPECLEGVLGALSDEAKFKGAISALASVMELSGIKSTKVVSKEQDKEGMVTFEKVLGFGEKSVFSFAPADADKLVEAAGKLEIKVADSTNRTSGAKMAETVAPLSLAEIEKIAGEAAAHMATYSTFKADMSVVNKAIATMKSKTSKVEGEDAARAKVAAKAAQAVLKALTSGLSAVRTYDVKTTGAVLSYCASSLAMYEAPKAAAAK